MTSEPTTQQRSEDDLTAMTVGPDQTLVLVSRVPLTPEAAARIRAQVPEQLRGLLVVVDGMDAYVLSTAPCVETCPGIGSTALACDLPLGHTRAHHDPSGATWTRA